MSDIAIVQENVNLAYLGILELGLLGYYGCYIHL
jgi:hypothetical protein